MTRQLSLLILLMLFAAFVSPVFGLDMWFPFVPQEENVSLSYWKQNGSSLVNVSIEFWSNGYNVSDCGLPVLQGENISVSAQIWRYIGTVLPFTWTWKHTYDLGSLPAGRYTFTFNGWGEPVKNITLTVGTIIVPDYCSTIQEAINNANEGDTVFVRNGTYFESLAVNKRMTLIGENKEGTLIDGKNATNTVSIASSNVAIQNFCIKGSYVRGIFVNSNNVTIQNCIVAENRQDGINVFSSQYCTFEDNLLYGNHQAMDVGHSNQNRIVSNRFVGNHVGILLSYSNKNIIQDNEVVESGFFGIDVQDTSSNNQITGNKLMNNDYGFVIISAGNNRFYHNNLINNIHQTYLNGALHNIWSDGCEGNYWSDCHGNDSEHDGVGDTSYIIDSNNMDNHPLMNPYWIPADVNHDLKVGIYDVVKITGAYGCTSSDPYWNPHADITEPFGKIDILDIVLCTSHYGEKYP